jgi:hypothetical protein
MENNMIADAYLQAATLALIFIFLWGLIYVPAAYAEFVRARRVKREIERLNRLLKATRSV